MSSTTKLKGWYVHDGNSQHGPLSGSDLKTHIQKGDIEPDFRVKHVDRTNGKWLRVGGIEAFTKLMPETKKHRQTISGKTNMADQRKVLIGGLVALCTLILISTVLITLSISHASQRAIDAREQQAKETRRAISQPYRDQFRKEQQQRYDRELDAYTDRLMNPYKYIKRDQ